MQSSSYRTFFYVKAKTLKAKNHKSEFHSYANEGKTVKDALRMTPLGKSFQAVMPESLLILKLSE